MTKQSFVPAKDFSATAKIKLLREVMECVMWEWRAVQDGKWEELPSHEARKQQLITRMSEFEWKPVISADHENPELLMLQAQIVDIEFQIRKRMEAQMDVIRAQLSDLNHRHIRWKKSMVHYAKASS